MKGWDVSEAHGLVLVATEDGYGESSMMLTPIEAGLFALELQRVAALVGGRYAKANAERARRARVACPVTSEPAPIGLPPLPPSGPSVRLGSEARPDEEETGKSVQATPTKPRRKR